MMTHARIALLLLAVVGAGVFATKARADQTYVVDGDTFVGIAYSLATGKFGYACEHRSRWDAEQAALHHCDAEDARIACWLNCGFCALALGDDPQCWGVGYSYGNGARLAAQERERYYANLVESRRKAAEKWRRATSFGKRPRAQD